MEEQTDIRPQWAWQQFDTSADDGPVSTSMTADEFRRWALEISGAHESSHMDHPDFRIGGKVFASLGYPDADHGMVKLTPEQQQTFLNEAPSVFAPCAGAWGRQGSTSVALAAAKVNLVRAALDAASTNVTSKKKKT
jgi:hypothetical protein